MWQFYHPLHSFIILDPVSNLPSCLFLFLTWPSAQSYSVASASPPSSRSYRLFLTSSHTLSALYLLQPLSSLLKILWFCLMIDEPHLIAYTWLLCHPSFSESVYMCSSAVLWLDVGTDQVRAPSVALYWRCLWSWVGHMRRDMLNNRVYFRCIGDKVECIKRPPVCRTLKAELR